MAIQMKRQGGGASNNAAATIPTALAYGEIGIDSAGNIYCGNGKAQVTSQVKNAANVLFFMFFLLIKMCFYTTNR